MFYIAFIILIHIDIILSYDIYVIDFKWNLFTIHANVSNCFHELAFSREVARFSAFYGRTYMASPINFRKTSYNDHVRPCIMFYIIYIILRKIDLLLLLLIKVVCKPTLTYFFFYQHQAYESVRICIKFQNRI